MKAGRELDALVAKHVMDLNPTWNIPNEDYFYTVNGSNNYLPYYSTSIAGAWQVVNKMIEKGTVVEVAQDQDECTVGIGYEGAWAIERCKSAPWAICLAALKAVGVERGE